MYHSQPRHERCECKANMLLSPNFQLVAKATKLTVIMKQNSAVSTLTKVGE
jgi:hypothetical protein